jgi:hypothetical protein
MFSDKCLKNWYLLPAGGSATQTSPASLAGEFAQAALPHFMQPSSWQICMTESTWHDDGFPNRCLIAHRMRELHRLRMKIRQ